ncbi:putative RNA methyltransferase [Streptomyces acidicola]|uniref:Methyltransferase type 11 n=1 Tax=Streptomyces acidicola TaxID=2596892 RepID=A0A5N8WZY8_9ACTN|nr:methyltransferase type 11 [Streptomyces acidicola]MPY51745.1 methyltransferase type 11 [Streptomyces acidicola]
MPNSSHAHHEPQYRLLDVLLCPLCGDSLGPADRALRCHRRHTFDVARHGYVSLLNGAMRPASADTAPMVQARAAFLQAGHYAPLARVLADLVTTFCPSDSTVLDAGAGTGYYLATVLDALPAAVGLGLDTSTYALRRAARAHIRASAAAWDIWQPLPVRTHSVDLLLNVFAPRNGPEFHRVLQPSGTLLTVTPAPQHLGELRRHLGLLSVGPAKQARLRRTLDPYFRLDRAEALEYAVTLAVEDIDSLAGMGPTAHHISRDELRRRTAPLKPALPVTASFRVSVYRPR